MRKQLAFSILPLAAMAVLSVPRLVSANCAAPDADVAMASQTVAGSALSPAAPHPTLGRAIVAAGNQVYVRALDTLDQIGTPLDLGATVESSPSPIQMEDNSFAAFVVLLDGTVARINPAGASPSMDWQVDLRRSGCTDDSLSATPVVHLRRFASAAFQERYTTDLVYVATRYDQSCSAGGYANRVYALDAATGATVWVFNADANESIDVVHEAPAMDYQSDRLFIGTDRRAATTQHSLWSIDVITGNKAWSAGVGAMYASPVVRDDRIYVATLAGEIKAINKSDGSTRWSVSNGGVPITTNIFREFRHPFSELITAVDYDGQVWLVRDDGNYGSTVWTVPLVDPSTGNTAAAVSRAALDPSNGKLYVGADDGQIYQLNIVDGSTEATRTVSAGSPVGGSSFVFEGANVNMVAGAASGALAKFCAPWAGEGLLSSVLPTCQNDTQCSALDPNPTPCSRWSCQGNICVALPSVADSQSCTGDGNNNTSGDQCNAGICLGYSSCQLEADACSCVDDDGSLVNRSLQVSQASCATQPPAGSGIDEVSWCGQEVSALVTQSSCLSHGTGARTAVWVQLFDAQRRPFAITPANGSVTMSLSGGAGTPPVFLSPTNFAPLSGTSASLSAGSVVASPSRVGTYVAYLGAQDALATPSGTTPWTVQLTAQLSNGSTCVDTTADSQVLSTEITMGHVDSQACPLDQNGFVRVRVSEGGGAAINQAPIRVGSPGALFAQTFEESIQNTPSGSGSALSDSNGVAEFVDVGNYLNGSVPVSATCPGGTIGDDNTVTVLASSASVEVALSCSAPGHVTYHQGGSIRRIAAVAGASPVNLSALLNSLSSGGDSYFAVSRNGDWMTIVTSRFGCGGWACVAIINSDFSGFEVPSLTGYGQLHPEGRTAISNDGNTLVFFDDGPHADDLYVTTRSGNSWSAPTLLTASSPHAFNKQPVLSPDGSKVLFDCGPGPYGQEGNGVCEVGIDGSGFVQVVDPDNNPFGGGSNFSARHGDYAPDGSYVFEADWAAEQIWRQASMGATPTQVIPSQTNDNSPCVLPNNNIASLVLPADPHELTLTAADGSSSVILVPGVDVADIGISCHD